MSASVVCDEQLMFAEAFAEALRRRGASRAVAAADPDATLALLHNHRYHNVVMDLGFHDTHGSVVLRDICRRWPATRVFALTRGQIGHTPPRLDVPVAAVLSKSRPLHELVTRVLSPASAGEGDARPAPARAPGLRRQEHDVIPLEARFLTSRERDVLGRLVAGERTAVIAEHLGISMTTTRGYVQSLLMKLGVHSRVEAAAYAVHHALVDPAVLDSAS